MSAPEHEIPKFQIKFTKVCLININTGEIKHVDCKDLYEFYCNCPIQPDLAQFSSNWKIFYAVPVTDHDQPFVVDPNTVNHDAKYFTREDQNRAIKAASPRNEDEEQAEQRAKDYFDRHYIVERKGDKEHGK